MVSHKYRSNTSRISAQAQLGTSNLWGFRFFQVSNDGRKLLNNFGALRGERAKKFASGVQLIFDFSFSGVCGKVAFNLADDESANGALSRIFHVTE